MKHHCYDNMLHVSHSVSVISIRMSAFVFRIWLENVEMVQCFGGFWLFLTRGLIWHLSKSSIRPSICFSLIVRSRLNPFLETTDTKSNKGNVSFSWKQRGGGLCWGSNPWLSHYKSDVQPLLRQLNIHSAHYEAVISRNNSRRCTHWCPTCRCKGMLWQRSLPSRPHAT